MSSLIFLFSNLLLAGTLVLASCVAIERDNPDDPKSGNYVDKSGLKSSVGEYSSSLVPPSSSSVEEREHYGKMKPVFTDPRDGKKYVYVKMGNKTWMAENLNYNADRYNAGGSKCYNDDPANCEKYGRLYNWETAKMACPSGWYLPSHAEWGDLYDVATPLCNDFCPTGTKLKSANGWDDWVGENTQETMSGNGTDDHGFTALPGGYYTNTLYDGTFFLNIGFSDIGETGLWWTSNEDVSDAYFYAILTDYEYLFWDKENKNNVFISVRCVKH